MNASQFLKVLLFSAGLSMAGVASATEATGNDGTQVFPGAALSQEGDRVSADKIKLTPPIQYPIVPKEVAVYKFLESKDGLEDTKQLAQKLLSVKDPKVVASEDGAEYRVMTDEWLLTVDAHMGSLTLRRRKPEPVGDKFPAERDCETIATDFLKKFGLLPANARFSGVADNTEGNGTMSVGFKCYIDGIKVLGAGARIIVEIGKGGVVEEAYKCWPNVEDMGKYPVLAPQEAMARFSTGHGVFDGSPNGVVESFELLYYAPPDKQKFLMPIYMISGQGKKVASPIKAVDAPNGFSGYIDALTPKHLKPLEKP